MTLWGYREWVRGRSLYRFYDSDREFCSAVSLRRGDEQIVAIRQADEGKGPLALKSTFDTERTLYRGLCRYVVDKEIEGIFGMLELDSSPFTLINRQFLAEPTSHVVRFWDPGKPGEPVACINEERRMPRMRTGRQRAGAQFYLFTCDDSLERETMLMMLLYPALKIV